MTVLILRSRHQQTKRAESLPILIMGERKQSVNQVDSAVISELLLQKLKWKKRLHLGNAGMKSGQSAMYPAGNMSQSMLWI